VSNSILTYTAIDNALFSSRMKTITVITAHGITNQVRSQRAQESSEDDEVSV